MARVRLVQLLCPERHCIVASAYEEGAAEGPKVSSELLDRMHELGIEKLCGICGSRDLNFEDSLTGFGSIEEAYAPLMEAQTANLLSRMEFDRLRKIQGN